ncbi:Wdr35 [Symbiodinium pilosum]|uniref:Wdr35 protein n=1 Tax=Symbiodinium pilosum TaxID=2952 RepID=A0A812RDJ0_SYMPI|nr:Wdr35 [Symbiodinium pilosum]
MFVYLSKKIAIPHQLALQVVSWNSAQGWIACGGESGLLKVLKLESASDGAAKAAAGQSNLSMNQTLEGHQGTIMVITWNENFRKLTTSDQNGLIIVWMLHRGIWFEEMINNRNRSVVRDMKWSADCQKICIIYEDGAVIVGTVDGQRLWGKEVKTQLAFVEWSPDGKNILFCTLNGEVHVYDNEGIYSHKVPIYCLDSGTEGTVAIAGIDWFAGPNGPENQTPTLCLGFENGRVQIMRSDADDKPVLLDTQLRCTGLKWDPNGSVIAIAGVQSQGAAAADREVGIVQFYAPSGQHLRSLRVPGQNLRSISWEGSGLRLALAVDSHIFFANIRPDYLWGYFSRTLVYAVLRKERNEHVVVFWDTHSDEKYTKYIKHVTHIRSSEEYCVLVTKADDASGQHIVIVCNDIGSPVDSKYMQLDPVHVAMTNSHVIVTSEDVVYIWSYRTSVSRQAQGDLASAAGMGIKQKRAEMMFHIDESFAPGSGTHDKESFVPPSMTTQDPIACICATEQCLLIARESGVVHRYALPHLSLEARFTIRCRPQVIAANCDSTRMSVIDINGVLLLFDIEIVNHGFFGQRNEETNSQENGPGKQLDFERKDVWNMRWATDNPDLFAIMEKTRMYIVRGLQPEEPVLSNAYICAFKDLQIQSVLIDEVIQNPENPRKEVLLDFETKSLRDTRDILTKVSNLKDAFNYVDANPHPRLWRLLAEAALEQLEFSVAEKAFVRFEDYQGIQLVKRLRLLDDRVKQKAEVAAYFQRFDEAESLYREIDRKDLAIDLRVRLGDWFRVIQLAHGANEELLHQAWSAIGDYYADRCKWPNAANYYAKAGNNAALVDTYYFLEDYDSLERLIPQLPEGSPLLTEVGNKFASVGLCEQAVQAYLRHGDVKTAVDTCVLLNQWELAVNLAQQHNFQQIEGLLAKYAQHLLDKNKKIEAVQLYRKASRHTEAAKLLNQMAREMPGGAQRHPDRIKKLYLLAAMEVEKFKNKTLDAQMTGATQGTMTTAQTLQSLVTQDQSVSSDRALESPWRGCEAFHLYLLSQRQLYEGQFEQAMKTSLRLAEYEDILDTQTIYSLIALTTYYNKFYMQCSKAFIKLEASGDVSDEMRTKFSDLALSIFIRSTPKDPVTPDILRLQDPVNQVMHPCPKCHTRINDWICNGLSKLLWMWCLEHSTILPLHATLESAGIESGDELTLVITSPTVEYHVMQGDAFSFLPKTSSASYLLMLGVLFKAKGTDPGSSKMIVQIQRKVGSKVKTTGRSWVGPAGGLWVELDPCFQKPGWVLVEGPGFGKAGPLLEEALPDEGEAMVMHFKNPFDDDEVHELCLKPAYNIHTVKKWMCTRLPFLRLDKIVIVKRRSRGRAARFTPSNFVLDDHVRLFETEFEDGGELPYIYLGDADEGEMRLWQRDGFKKGTEEPTLARIHLAQARRTALWAKPSSAASVGPKAAELSFVPLTLGCSGGIWLSVVDNNMMKIMGEGASRVQLCQQPGMEHGMPAMASLLAGLLLAGPTAVAAAKGKAKPQGDGDDSALLFFLLAMLTCLLVPWTAFVAWYLLFPGHAEVAKAFPETTEHGSRVRYCRTQAMEVRRETAMRDLSLTLHLGMS